jgi:glycosyltransferase involved in cell wall biosynthesis
VKLSIVYITNGKRLGVLNKCILSSLNIADETIVVGNVSSITHDVIKIEATDLANGGFISAMRNIGAAHATGDIIINADDDIYFPFNFKKKLLKFVNANPNFGSVTTKVVGINGSRYWDRAIHTANNESFMIEYNEEHPDLYYSGAFIIRQKWFADKYKWDDRLKYYEKEDVEYSNRIRKEGNKINIDVNNYVAHIDPTYVSYRNGDGRLVCDRIDRKIDDVQGEELREIKALLNIPKFNIGCSEGRNIGVSLIKTKYFILLDDDVEFTENTKLDILYDIIKKSDLDILGGLVMENGKSAPYFGNFKQNGDVVHCVSEWTDRGEYKECEIVHNFFIALTEKVREHGWDGEVKTGEHDSFFFDHRNHLKVGYTDKVSVNHNQKRSVPYNKFRFRANVYVKHWMKKHKLKKFINLHGMIFENEDI